MSENRVAIFEAASIDAAYRLREALARHGIAAWVLAGGTPPAWDEKGRPVAARVVVDALDSERARHVARVWERSAAVGPAVDPGPSNTTEADATQAPFAERCSPDWPRCPECGTPRLTWCPICQTSGTRFSPADEVPPEAFDQLSAEGLGDACGLPSCACRSGFPASKVSVSQPADADSPLDPRDTQSRLLLCPTCDEPFEPQFARRCEWCGHEFADGIDWTPPAEDDGESLSARAVAILAGLLGLAILLLGYLAYVW